MLGRLPSGSSQLRRAGTDASGNSGGPQTHLRQAHGSFATSQTLARVAKSLGLHRRRTGHDNHDEHHDAPPPQQQEGGGQRGRALTKTVLRRGRVPVPVADAKIKIKIVVMLLDGSEVFRSKGGWVVDPQSARVMEGLRIALPLMCVGERARLVVPPQLAYGSHGYPPT